MEQKRNIKYTGRDFESLRKNLIDYVKLYYPRSYGDFTPTSVGMMMVELMSYVGDVLSYYQDRQYNEVFNPYEKKNAIRLLKFFGGKYKAKTQSNLLATVYILVPSAVVSGEIQPDEDYLPLIKKGMIASTSDNKQFISIEDVDFRDVTDREIAVYSSDSNGTPTYYAIRKPVKMVSGVIDEFNYNVGDPQEFLSISLPENRNVLEILSVKDSEGDDWYEVEYLAQDEIFISEPNQNATKYSVPLLLKSKKVQKRFITDVDETGTTTLMFGSSVGNLDSGIIYPNPSRFLVNSLSDNIGFFSFNSNLILQSGSLGLSPANTVLTVRYLYGGGSPFNIRVGELNTMVSRQLVFQSPIASLNSTKYQNVVNSLTITNNEQGRDGVDEFSVEDLKQIIPIFYSSQKRAVTLEDFQAILFSLPSKFGNIYRAMAVNDLNDDKSVALYVLTKDNENNLGLTSDELKDNVKIFLKKFKMFTDNINIYDGEIVNFGIEYEVVIKDGYNESEVKERIEQTLYEYFKNSSFNFGENIYLSKIVKLVDEIDGVLTVTDILIKNLVGNNYSETIFNFLIKNINNIISPNFNQIFELKYKSDITGIVRIL